MIWDGISIMERTELYSILNGSMTFPEVKVFNPHVNLLKLRFPYFNAR